MEADRGLRTQAGCKGLTALAPEEVILALPLAALRALPAEYLRTLSAEVQEQIQRRLQEAAH